MKANEAPDKLYFDVNNNLIGLYDSAILGMFSAKNTETAIEYTRTDAFIEKACAWLKENKDKYLYNTGEKGEYIPTCSGKIVDDFRAYIEGEKV